ncbi:MAG TPA: hypothetical protein DCW68_05575 [Rhodospirillaceae bacterium]|nr:MAG: hypothetical protein A2018_02080 [Alphaproteobacteria bacterium GWF2_58_20]HAU29565.1 hypothetical protein [Rhodospirillaceae bacterium]
MEHDIPAQIRDCVTWCGERNLLPLLLHFPKGLTPDIPEEIPPSCIAGFSMESPLGKIVWRTSSCKARTLAVITNRVPWEGLDFSTALQARKMGIRHMVRRTPTGWKSVSLSRFLIQRLQEKLLWTLLGRFLAARNAGKTHHGNAYHRLCRQHSPLYMPTAPDSILVLNSSLASGGSERQVANTLSGLHHKGFQNLSLLCRNLHDPQGSDFYLPHLEQHGIPAREIGRAYSGEERKNLLKIIEKSGNILQRLPEHLAEQVVIYALEILNARPQIVHAWQDSTSIFAGLAAVMAGVPRIVLAGRNMTPRHFGYFQPWMRPAYQALAQHPNVVMINNSTAGARDYERWLGLPEGHIRVLFNGMNSANLIRSRHEDVMAWRRKLGVPDTARLVGSIFRFYPEKDPMLWVETAALLAKKHPESAFLILGDGPLRAQMEDAIRKHGLENRFFLPGVDKESARALSAMEAFLLTSKLEGTPNVCIEAQWLGVPVVATDAGGTADTFADGTTGFLVRDRKPGELADKLSFILSSPDWVKKASETAPAFVRGRFGMDRMIDETLEVYGLK